MYSGKALLKIFVRMFSKKNSTSGLHQNGAGGYNTPNGGWEAFKVPWGEGSRGNFVIRSYIYVHKLY